MLNSQSNGNSLEESWPDLETSFTHIHTRNASNLSYEQLYRLSYRVVLKKQGAELYRKVIEFERDWLVASILPKLRRLVSPELLAPASTSIHATERRRLGDVLLKGAKQEWKDHLTCIAMMSDVLMYLVRRHQATDHQISVRRLTASVT
jgi:cullin 3